MRRHLLLCMLALALWGTGAAAWAARWVLVVPEGEASHAEAAEACVQELLRSGAARADVLRLSPAALLAGAAPEGPDTLLITLGADALRTALQQRRTAPVLATLIPRAAFDKVLADGARGPAPVHALFLDQPALRQLDLLRLALPELERVGLLWSRESQALLPGFQTAARQRGLELVAPRVAARGEERAPLAQVLAEAQVLVALPDPTIYHSGSIANLLLASYRAGVPMLGFSPAYVRAGALLGLYSTPRQIGLQSGQRAWALLAAPPLGATSVYPSDFTVDVNTHVARSLGRSLDAAELGERLRLLERRP